MHPPPERSIDNLIRAGIRMATIPALLAAIILCAACSEPNAQVAEKPTPVRVELVSSGPAAPAIATNGSVATKGELRLSFKSGGIIKSILVNPGEKVTKGQKLAEIELAEVNSQLEQAQQMAAKAQRDLERSERLYTDQVISLEQLQDLRTQAAMASAQLRSAQFNRGYSVITAPSDGVVLRKLAEERELVPAGRTVLIVGAQEEGFVVKAALSDRDVVKLELDDPAEIRLDAFPDQVLKGTLSEIAAAADERTGMFPVEVRFEGPSVPLVSGLVAKLTLHPSAARTSELAYVPIAAIVEGDGDRASVFVLNGNRVKRREVRIAFIAPEAVALAEGLEPGEQIVTDGAAYLQDDDRIEIVIDGQRNASTTEMNAG